MLLIETAADLENGVASDEFSRFGRSLSWSNATELSGDAANGHVALDRHDPAADGSQVGAMDAGLDVRRTQTMSFHGPFASISVGLGG